MTKVAKMMLNLSNEKNIKACASFTKGQKIEDIQSHEKGTILSIDTKKPNMFGFIGTLNIQMDNGKVINNVPASNWK